MLDPKRIPPFTAIRLQGIAGSALKPRIDVNGRELVLYRYSLQALTEGIHQKKAVGTAAEPNGDAVTIGYHPVPMDGLAHRPVQPLVYPALPRHRHLKSPKQRRHTLFDLLFLIFGGNLAGGNFPKGHNNIFILR
jgi:hypothetical protein